MKQLKYFIFFLLLISGFFIWLFIRYIYTAGLSSDLDSDKERVIVFLLAGLHNNQKIENANIVFLNNKQKHFYTYSVHPGVACTNNKNPVKIFSLNSFNRVKQELEKIIGRKIDYTLKVDNKDILKLVKIFGGTSFINTVSSNNPFGPVYINSSNYFPFLKKLKRKNTRRDTVYSIWYNMLHKSLILYNSFKKGDVPVENIYNHVSTDLSRRDFLNLTGCFIRNITNIYSSYSRMNVEIRKTEQNSYFFPLKNGSYDRRKINKALRKIASGDAKIKCFPLTLQIKNATLYNRLAAFAAGRLHYKRCDVQEYMTSDFRSATSFIIDRCGSVIKRNY
ncbi:MAG TPA: hypothetical protein VKS21_10940, partial [Spirochaetota bacterium]|nr:hypothetical protein [Spirochaetota bacterium]